MVLGRRDMIQILCITSNQASLAASAAEEEMVQRMRGRIQERDSRGKGSTHAESGGIRSSSAAEL